MNAFSKTPENRCIIRDITIVNMLKSVLIYPSANLQRVTCGLLFELSKEPEGAFIIMNSGSCQSIEELTIKYQNAQENTQERKIGRVTFT